MTIQIDTREKARAITKIIAEFDKHGIVHYNSKLYVGDYMSLDNPRLIIDRKQNLFELCGNVCQQHKRFRDEIERANKAGIKLIFLCEHGRGIKVLDDVRNWINPRLEKSPLAVSGERLYKTLSTMQAHYDIEFLFCNKNETGRKIIELLTAT